MMRSRTSRGIRHSFMKELMLSRSSLIRLSRLVYSSSMPTIFPVKIALRCDDETNLEKHEKFGKTKISTLQCSCQERHTKDRLLTKKSHQPHGP